MIKDVVRTDSLKGRRGRLPSRPKSKSRMAGGGGSDRLVIEENCNIPPIVQLVRQHIDTSPASTQIDFSQFNSIEFEQYGNPPPDHILYMRRLGQMVSGTLESCKLFAEKIPGFVDLPKNDQQILCESGCLDLMIMKMAYRNEPQDTKIVCCDGLALQRNQLYPFLHEWIDEFFEFSNRLHVVNIDLSSMACLSALALLVPELKDLQEPQKIIKMRDDCHDWLANNCRVNENVSDRQGYREKVLSVLHFVHENMTPRLHSKMIMMKQSNLLPNDQYLQHSMTLHQQTSLMFGGQDPSSSTIAAASPLVTNSNNGVKHEPRIL